MAGEQISEKDMTVDDSGYDQAVKEYNQAVENLRKETRKRLEYLATKFQLMVIDNCIARPVHIIINDDNTIRYYTLICSSEHTLNFPTSYHKFGICCGIDEYFDRFFPKEHGEPPECRIGGRRCKVIRLDVDSDYFAFLQEKGNNIKG